MTDLLRTQISDEFSRWFYHLNFRIRVPAAQEHEIRVKDKEGRTFEVIDVGFEYAWDASVGRWYLVNVELKGALVLDDGFYGEESSREYWDPLKGDEEQRAPVWVQRLADERSVRIPAPRGE